MVLDSSSDSHRSNRSSSRADSNSRLRQAASSAGAARTRSARFWLQAASQRASKAEVPSLAVKEDKRGSSNSSSRSGGVSAWISRVVHKGAKRAAGKAANSHPKRSRNMACSRTVASAAEEAAVALGLQGVLARTRNARTKRG